ncbi:MAG: hypothetical protein M0P73_18665 [Syntrophobacterales bacterium]|jgi:hypothetical protein|nr:hypothetical protein [Syntrophobacterales bacterium]
MWSVVLAALPVGALLAAPAQAQLDQIITTTRTATLGQVRAILSYQEKTFTNPLADWRLYQPRLQVIREGQTVLDEALPGVGPDGVQQIDGPEVRPLKGLAGTFDEVLNRDVKNRQEFFAMLRRQLKKHGYAR